MAYVMKLENYHHLTDIRKAMEIAFIGNHSTIVYAPNGTTYDNLFRLMCEAVKDGYGTMNGKYVQPNFFFHNPAKYSNLDFAERYQMYLIIPEINKDAFINPYKDDDAEVVYQRIAAAASMPIPTFTDAAWERYKDIVYTVDRSQRRYYSLRLISESHARWRGSAHVEDIDLDYAYPMCMEKPMWNPNLHNVWHTPTVTSVPVSTSANKDDNFTYATPYAQSVWTINHNLSNYPNVTTFDSSGQEMFGDVVYVSPNTVTVTFAYALSGTANLIL